jgi:threonyl-tRNA synthetase
VVVGAREAGTGAAALRLRDGRRIGSAPAGDLVDRIAALVAACRPELWDDGGRA